MIIQIRIEVKGEAQLQNIVKKAIALGYLRSDPKKAWSQIEYKEAAKFYFENVVKQAAKQATVPAAMTELEFINMAAGCNSDGSEHGR